MFLVRHRSGRVGGESNSGYAAKCDARVGHFGRSAIGGETATTHHGTARLYQHQSQRQGQ